MQPDITISDALRQGAKILEDAGIEAPRLNAEVLLAHAAHQSRAWLYAHGADKLTELWWIHYGRYLHERATGKPTQYITKKQEFYGREFRVSPAVLIPRPETEFVVEAALKRLTDFRGGSVLDIGAGSGAIAVTLALHAPGSAAVYATDISRAALDVARANAAALHADVRFVEADLGGCFADRSFAMIVSNPPYIAVRDSQALQREVRDHEPALALFSEEDGMAHYRRILADAPRLLQPGGWLVLELAHDSAERLAPMLGSSWHDMEWIPDLAGHVRVLAARWQPA